MFEFTKKKSAIIRPTVDLLQHHWGGLSYCGKLFAFGKSLAIWPSDWRYF